ncbi:MAG: hypothetical protein KA956_05975 [Pyrinomonadaceae bacterium]|nr:hypothetical protein [Acidobacteriota bacterium]MBP7376005.1 hypothetical protein [Pyrinomonadaceae bacterium]
MKKLLTLSLLSLMFLTMYVETASAQTRIRFARGRTSATVSSTIGSRGQRKYVLGAQAGQTLSANISSRNGCVVLGNGQTSENYTTNRGDNWIDIFNNCKTATTFTLTVSIY